MVAPGSVPSRDEAVSRGIQAAASVFDNCTPSAVEPVIGTVSRQKGNSSPIAMRCEAEVIQEPGLDLVVLAA